MQKNGTLSEQKIQNILEGNVVHVSHFTILCITIPSAKVVFKGLLTSDWQVKKDFKVKQILDANIPNYELEHVHTVKKSSNLFTNKKNLEREGSSLNIDLMTKSTLTIKSFFFLIKIRKMNIKERFNSYLRSLTSSPKICSTEMFVIEL